MFWFLRKASGKQTKAVNTTEAGCDILDARSYAGGSVTVSAGITLLTLYAANDLSDTFLPYYNKDNDPVELIVATTQITQLPMEIYDVMYVKFVANTSGTIYLAQKS
jgi:hypothetical protein